MCFGGSKPQPATIFMPATDQYDDQLDRQYDLLRQQMDNQNKLMQQQIQSGQDRNAALMERIVAARESKADSAEYIDQQVQDRLDAIRGPVEDLVPEQGAQMVISSAVRPGEREKGASRDSDVIDRGGAKKSGKSGLRIRLTSQKASQGKGTGLNIT